MSGINDKWSYYTRAEDLAALYEDKTGSYAGIGVTVTQDAETGRSKKNSQTSWWKSAM